MVISAGLPGFEVSPNRRKAAACDRIGTASLESGVCPCAVVVSRQNHLQPVCRIGEARAQPLQPQTSRGPLMNESSARLTALEIGDGAAVTWFPHASPAASRP